MSVLSFLLQELICYIETACVDVANLAIAALASLVALVVGALPAMPSLPSVPAAVLDGMSYGAYFFPVSYMVTTIALVGSLWLAWMVVAIPLRWAKATGGS